MSFASLMRTFHTNVLGKAAEQQWEFTLQESFSISYTYRLTHLDNSHQSTYFKTGVRGVWAVFLKAQFDSMQNAYKFPQILAGREKNTRDLGKKLVQQYLKSDPWHPRHFPVHVGFNLARCWALFSCSTAWAGEAADVKTEPICTGDPRWRLQFIPQQN